MSFTVLHFECDKDLLVERVKLIADQLKNEELNFDEGEWEQAVDRVVNGDFSRPELASIVLSLTLYTSFPSISKDWKISAYEALANKTAGKLAKTLRMFVNGRNFSTGNSGFGDEMTCGYLTPDEVREFLELIKAYTPDSTVSGEKEFVDSLIDIFSMLVEKNSGDLFAMSE